MNGLRREKPLISSKLYCPAIRCPLVIADILVRTFMRIDIPLYKRRKGEEIRAEEQDALARHGNIRDGGHIGHRAATRKRLSGNDGSRPHGLKNGLRSG